MLAHRLREKVQIQKKTTVKNPETGSLSDNWFDLFEVWADPRFINGNETLNRGVVNTTRVDFFVRYRSEIDYNCRLIWNSEIYDIKVIEPIDRKNTLRLQCDRV